MDPDDVLANASSDAPLTRTLFAPQDFGSPNGLGKENLAIRSLRQSFEALSRACSNIQILQLAQSFRQWSDDEIIHLAEVSRRHRE